MFRLSRLQVLAFVIVLCCASISGAQELYYTSEPGESLDLLNFSTGSSSLLASTASISGKPDSLILNSKGQILYSIPNLGQVWLFDPTTSSNTLLVTGLSYPRDMVIEPGEMTMLISLNARGQIARYNFVTGAVTLLIKGLGSTDGLAYAPNGDLFAVVGRNRVCQIDPVKGVLLKCITLEAHYKTNGGDGMTYDPYSRQLWVSHDGTMGNGLIEIPTDLSSDTWFQTGKILVPDGIVSDGNGNLFIGAGLHTVVEYNIPTNTIVKSVLAPGVDDVVLIPGTY
jgi:hypothetical protein